VKVAIPAAGFDPEKVKAFLKKIVPIAKIIATFTPTPFDDMIVALLASWIDNPQLALDAAHAANASS
jgi:hypothetical protein